MDNPDAGAAVDAAPGGGADALSVPDAAPEAFEGDPEGEGPYTVFEHVVSIPGPAADIAGTVYAPSVDGGATVHADAGPYPLVIVMHGFTASHTQYASFSRHIASWGFIAIGIDFTDDGAHDQNANEAIAAIDFAGTAGSPVADVVDLDRIATAGHSLGGKIAFFAAVLDDRVDTVIGWDPVDSGGPPCFIDPDGCHNWSIAPNSFDGDEGMMADLDIPILIFAAPSGAFNPEVHHARRFWEGAESPAQWVYFPSGAHTNWPGAALEERITKRTQVAWLARHLQGLSGVEPFLSGDIIGVDVTAGDIELEHK
jgi:pimeloyl-ACP methyl ester carboxylesterase